MDLVNVFVAGEYEEEAPSNATWATGHWNGDGEFTSNDIVVAFKDGGYERGPRVAQAVPEPTAVATFLIPMLVGIGLSRIRFGREVI